MPAILAALFDLSGPAFWMSAAGLALLVVGLWAALAKANDPGRFPPTI
jgi:hypothetical protein